MENATKALLIAAAVLATIVVIALGISILKSVSGTGQQADELKIAIDESTKKTTKSTLKSLRKLREQTKEEFNGEYQQYVTNVNNRNYWGITSDDLFELLEMNNERDDDERKISVGGPGLDFFRDKTYLYYFLPRYDEDGYLIYLSYNQRTKINN